MNKSTSAMADICKEFGETDSFVENERIPAFEPDPESIKPLYKGSSLKKLSLVIDERETKLYDAVMELVRLGTFNITQEQIIKRVLILGDVCIRNADEQDVCIMERKTAQDLIASIKDTRYEEQSHRLIHASNIKPHNIVYIIENTLENSCKPCENKMFYSAIVSLSMFKGFSVMKTANIYETAELVISFLEKIQKNFNKNIHLYNTATNATANSTTNENYSTFVKKIKHENISKTNFAEIVLTQIPGLSSVTACAVMKQYKHLGDLIDTLKTNKDCLENIKTESNGKLRKLGKNVISSIKEFLVFSETSVTALALSNEVVIAGK